MKALGGGLLFFILSTAAASSESEFVPDSGIDQSKDLPRYVVFPGLDAEEEEIAEWNFGFASPFNVFFGPKPYILGWVGEAPFGPAGEEGEEGIEGGEGDYGEGEEVEGGEGGEEGEGIEGEEEEGFDPDYDYEKF